MIFAIGILYSITVRDAKFSESLTRWQASVLVIWLIFLLCKVTMYEA